jgi:uncharacterized LabA/DUF88 family protein
LFLRLVCGRTHPLPAAVGMVSRAYKHHFDEAVLVSGDGDCASVVQEVKDSGKQVEVAYFGRCRNLRTDKSDRTRFA